MGIAKIEPPPPGAPSIFDLPWWLLIPLGLVWVYFVLREPKNGGPNPGWYMPPSVITIVVFVLYAGASRLA